tara:strand:+ start:1377 stop:3923 length:2547 start_codon:yes stop_codon:yes gene_type:complete
MSLPIFKTELDNSNIKSNKCPKSSDVEYVNGIPVYDIPNDENEKLNKKSNQPEGCYMINYGATEKDNAKNIYEKECPKKNRTGIYYRDTIDNNLLGICHIDDISSLQKSPVEKFIMFLIMSLTFVITFAIIACCGEFWLKFGHGKKCIKVINTCLNIGKDSTDNTASLTEQHFRFRISNYPYQKCNKTSTNIEGGAFNSHNKAKTEIDIDEIESDNCIYQNQDDNNINGEKPFPYNIGEYADNNFDGELSKIVPRMITFAITCFMMSFRYIFNIANKMGCDMYDKVGKNKYTGLLLFIFIPVILTFVSGFMTIIPFIGAIVFVLYFGLSVLETIALHYGFFFNQNNDSNIIAGFFIIAGIILSVYGPLHHGIYKYVVKANYNRYNNKLKEYKLNDITSEYNNTTDVKKKKKLLNGIMADPVKKLYGYTSYNKKNEKFYRTMSVDEANYDDVATDYIKHIENMIQKKTTELNEAAKYLESNHPDIYSTLDKTNCTYCNDTQLKTTTSTPDKNTLEERPMSANSDKFFMAGGILAILIGGTLHQLIGKNKPINNENDENNENDGNNENGGNNENDGNNEKEKIDPEQKVADIFRKPLKFLLRIFEFDKLTDKQKEQYYNYRPEKLTFTKDSYKINGKTIVNIIFAIILLITFTSSSNSSDAIWPIIYTWIGIFVFITILILLKGFNPDNFPLWTSTFRSLWFGLSEKSPDRNKKWQKSFWTKITTYLKDPIYDIGYIGYVFKKILYIITHLLMLLITLFLINPVFGICYLFSILDIIFKFFLTPIFGSPRLFFELLKKRSLFLTLFFCVLVITSIQKSHLFGEQTNTTVGIMAAVFAIIVLYNIYKSNKE